VRYTLLTHYLEPTDKQPLDEATKAEGRAAMSAYAASLHAAGVLVAAEVLTPSVLTTTVTVRDGVLQVQDGPFADTKEQLGGTFVIDVPDLDAAIEWARRSPAAGWGAVEVRPGATFTRDGVWVPNT